MLQDLYCPNRPYNDGEHFNCLMLQSEMRVEGDLHFVTERSFVNDEDCEVPICPVCLIDKQVMKMRVRGLCSDSLFNKEYLFTITEEGSLMCVGDHTSYIYYHQDSHGNYDGLHEPGSQ